jgi:hypothetical protein
MSVVSKAFFRKNCWSLVCVFLFSVTIFMYFIATKLHELPCANILSIENARLELQINSSMLTFYGTLSLSLLLGILNIYPRFKEEKTVFGRRIFSILYFLFGGGIVYVFSKIYGILSENIRIITTSKLGSDLAYWNQYTTFFNVYTDPFLFYAAYVIIIFIILLILDLLYLNLINNIENQSLNEKKTSKEISQEIFYLDYLDA